jgi:hypothetical protein
VHHPYLEAVAIEPEVLLDPADEPFHTGVRADRAPSTTRPVRANEAGTESLLIRPAQEPLQGPPVRAFDPLQ